MTDLTIIKLMAVIREADDENPEGMFGVGVIEEEGSVEDGERLLQDILPDLEHRVTQFQAARRRRRGKLDG